jgi:RNA recognition motif-containing protein
LTLPRLGRALLKRPASVCHLHDLAFPPPGYPGRRLSSIHCETLSVTKLYVGNLPFSATEDTVRTLFAEHGAVEKVALVNDRDTGRPRGFGFVEMSNADASRAMQALNGKDFGGRPLKVNEAQDKPRTGGGGGGGGGGGYGRRFKLQEIHGTCSD